MKYFILIVCILVISCSDEKEASPKVNIGDIVKMKVTGETYQITGVRCNSFGCVYFVRNKLLKEERINDFEFDAI